ncbi:MAG: AMP-binding protein [Alphaproteobacteria bacterium]
MDPHSASASDGGLDTFPKRLLVQARERANSVFLREKNLGIWQSVTWAQALEQSRSLALGLAAHGLVRGDKVAIIGDNRPYLYLAMAAVQSIGGVPVPMYQDSIADELQYILEHSEVCFAIVEDQEQVDKVLQVREHVPQIKKIVYHDPRGLRHYDEPGLERYAEVQERGKQFDSDNPDFFLDEIAKGEGADLAIMLYTSGTTGKPKGVMLSYNNLIRMSLNGIAYDNLTDREVVLAYLPMAWVGDHLFSYGQAICAGFTVNCPESGATVLSDLREIGPTYFFAPPRIWESILTTVLVRIEDAAAIKRRMFHYFMKVAERAGVRLLDGEPVGFMDRLKYGLGEIFVYGPLRDNLGFSGIRVAYTAGEAIGPEIFSFYRSLGINIKQIYGMTEATVLVCGQRDGEVDADSVGVPMPEVEVRITDDGEVEFRSPGTFIGYFKNDEATKETKTPDGWIHSGDAGYFDDLGRLRIIDRAKDVGKLVDGTMFAPKFIENKLKFSPYVLEAVTYGDGRDKVAAFINIDLAAVGNWAEKRGLAYTSYSDLAAQSAVYDLIAGEIGTVNAALAADPKLAGSQIQRFLILHKELDPDDNELTRTRKVRRRFVAEKYEELIDALYSGADQVAIEARVTFEDGREGTVSADLSIRDVAPVAALAEAV